jgi:hypothetical protein
VFRSLFSRKAIPLSGTPAVRRMKTYSAQSGYVYQYYYEGHRGATFVFSVSADRKTWSAVTVAVRDRALESWEQAHARELSDTERYAVAKMALFQAFDEPPTPAGMRAPVEVRPADVEAIIETLGL